MAAWRDRQSRQREPATCAVTAICFAAYETGLQSSEAPVAANHRSLSAISNPAGLSPRLRPTKLKPTQAFPRAHAKRRSLRMPRLIRSTVRNPGPATPRRNPRAPISPTTSAYLAFSKDGANPSHSCFLSTPSFNRSFALRLLRLLANSFEATPISASLRLSASWRFTRSLALESDYLDTHSPGWQSRPLSSRKASDMASYSGSGSFLQPS